MMNGELNIAFDRSDFSCCSRSRAKATRDSSGCCAIVQTQKKMTR